MKITLEKLQKWGACEEAICEFVSQTETDAKKLIIKLIDYKIEWAEWLLIQCLTKKKRIEYAKYTCKWIQPYIEQINYGLTLLK